MDRTTRFWSWQKTVHVANNDKCQRRANSNFFLSVYFLYTFFGDTFCILSGYVRPSRQCWEKTRCLMTANGSENDVITSEGLPSYQVPSCTGVESGLGRILIWIMSKTRARMTMERMSSMAITGSGKRMTWSQMWMPDESLISEWVVHDWSEKLQWPPPKILH